MARNDAASAQEHSSGDAEMSQWAIGAHVPASGGLATRAIPYAERIKATALQVYVSNPRGWALAAGRPDQDERLRSWSEQASIPVFIHAAMLVNLGSPEAEIRRKSAAVLKHALARAEEIGARGVVFHGGSARTPDRFPAALADMGAAVRELLGERDGPQLLVEPTAGGGQPLLARLEQLDAYFTAAEHHPRLGVCLDTCHVFAAGHDLRTEAGVTQALDLLTDTVGHRLGLIHVNDSRDPLGSHRDRHDNLGKGQLGLDGLTALFTHPAARGVPMVVETPTSEDGAGHAADIAVLRQLATDQP